MVGFLLYFRESLEPPSERSSILFLQHYKSFSTTFTLRFTSFMSRFSWFVVQM